MCTWEAAYTWTALYVRAYVGSVGKHGRWVRVYITGGKRCHEGEKRYAHEIAGRMKVYMSQGKGLHATGEGVYIGEGRGIR